MCGFFNFRGLRHLWKWPWLICVKLDTLVYHRMMIVKCLYQLIRRVVFCHLYYLCNHELSTTTYYPQLVYFLGAQYGLPFKPFCMTSKMPFIKIYQNKEIKRTLKYFLWIMALSNSHCPEPASSVCFIYNYLYAVDLEMDGYQRYTDIEI